MDPWWKRWPGRLEHELEALRAAGIRYDLDEEARSRGAIRLRLWAVIDAEELEFLAHYPAGFPHLRFEVYAPTLILPHHQNPFERNLCLLGADTALWQPADTLASFIVERLPLVLTAGRAAEAEAVTSLEIHQAEPITTYFGYGPGIVLVDSGWALDADAHGGELRLCVDPQVWPLRAVVESVRSAGSRGATGDPALVASFGQAALQLQARWVRIHDIPRGGGPEFVLRAATDARPDLHKPLWQVAGDLLLDIIGVVLTEEIAWRTSGDGWVFHVRAKRRSEPRMPEHAHLVRAGRAGRTDLRPRIRDVRHLTDATVGVVGIGAVGAPSALEFARAGVGELRLMDFDVVEPGGTPRWPLGMGAAGEAKVGAIGRFIAAQYPYTKVAMWDHRIGNAAAAEVEIETLERFLASLDVLYDATAELGVQHFLSDLAREHDIPFLCVSGTHGAWGGLVARIRPTRDAGCWLCLQLSLRDGSIPAPPADPDGEVQPLGCAAPTFTGTGFDVIEVALMGVRLASMLLAAPETPAWDVAVLGLRGSDGLHIPPTWRTYRLDRHLECGAHHVH